MAKSLEAEMHAMLSQALERCESLKMEAADAQRTAALKMYPGITKFILSRSK
jgi:hypothetical protein